MQINWTNEFIYFLLWIHQMYEFIYIVHFAMWTHLIIVCFYINSFVLSIHFSAQDSAAKDDANNRSSDD